MPSANTRHRAFGPGMDPKFDQKSIKKESEIVFGGVLGLPGERPGAILDPIWPQVGPGPEKERFLELFPPGPGPQN